MTRNEMIESLCDKFGISYPEQDDDGNYIIENSYDFEAGCSMGRGGAWLNLKNVVRALECYCEEEDC